MAQLAESGFVVAPLKTNSCFRNGRCRIMLPGDGGFAEASDARLLSALEAWGDYATSGAEADLRKAARWIYDLNRRFAGSAGLGRAVSGDCLNRPETMLAIREHFEGAQPVGASFGWWQDTSAPDGVVFDQGIIWSTGDSPEQLRTNLSQLVAVGARLQQEQSLVFWVNGEGRRRGLLVPIPTLYLFVQDCLGHLKQRFGVASRDWDGAARAAFEALQLLSGGYSSPRCAELEFEVKLLADPESGILDPESLAKNSVQLLGEIGCDEPGGTLILESLPSVPFVPAAGSLEGFGLQSGSFREELRDLLKRRSGAVPGTRGHARYRWVEPEKRDLELTLVRAFF